MKLFGRSEIRTALTVLTAFAFLTVSLLSTIADTSEGFEVVNTGDTAVYFKSDDDLTNYQFGQLFDDYTKETIAKDILAEALVKSTDLYSYTNLDFSKICVEKGLGKKVTGDAITTVDSMKISGHVSFKATYTEGIFDETSLFDTSSLGVDSIDLVKYTGGNKISRGDVIEFDSDFKIYKNASTEKKFLKNDNGEFVITSVRANTNDLGSKMTIDISSAKLEMTIGGSSKKVSIDTYNTSRVISDLTYDFDNVKVSKVGSDTDCYAINNLDFTMKKKVTYSCDGGTKRSVEINVSNDPFISALFSGVYSTKADVIVDNVTVSTEDLKFYDADPDKGLFPSPGNGALESDDKMSQYLDSIGNTTEEYGTVVSLSDSISEEEKTMFWEDKTMLTYIGMGAMGIVIVLLLIALIRKR